MSFTDVSTTWQFFLGCFTGLIITVVIRRIRSRVCERCGSGKKVRKMTDGGYLCDNCLTEEYIAMLKSVDI